jgi:hypothetical protein
MSVHRNGGRYMQYYSSLIREEILPFTQTWKHFENIMQNERKVFHDLVYMES